ncbi:Peptidase family M23 [Saccharicrinis carchari]|uniref:Peptidase family M23 n=1 Tax=Saccharicrinis carchari TaxID=1168039 RepID=A0A521DPS1_SACCC|nr:M23 family metallopeptidase [Saccharicrinis carchari]SMO73101.1 Peptidase family M23 [Saccharicrinis carchari]
MAKEKYVFDPDTLMYVRVDTGFKQVIKRLFPYMLAGGVVGLMAFAVLAFGSYTTPKEKLQAQLINKLKVNQKVLNERINEASSTLQHLVALDDSLYRTMLGENALSRSIRQAGTGGTNKYENLERNNTPEGIIKSFKELDKLVAKMNVQENSYEELFKKSMANMDRLQHLPAIIPVANWDLKRIGSGFNPRRFHPILNRWRPHKGIDLVANTGTDIYASADGRVKSVRYSDSFGKMVKIDHGYGLVSLYAHMNSQKVKVGDHVKRGQVIGEVGSTGLSAGPHLHYEIHLHGVEVDPVKYFFKDLSPQEYKAVVAQAQSIDFCME